MRNFIQFLVKYHIFLFFVGLEAACFWLIFRNNNYHNASFVNSANSLVGGMLTYKSNLGQYIELQRVNQELAEENEMLRNMLPQAYLPVNEPFAMVDDVLSERKYRYRNARVVNSSVNRQLNYLTINKGRREGIKPEMGVISSAGLVGAVKDVSEHFSTVIPIVNVNFAVSAALKKSGHYGLLRWDGKDYRFCALNDVPGHIRVNIGDTLVTRESSAIYPRDIPIGTVYSVEQRPGSNFQQITVALSNDFNALRFVYVIENLLKEEQLQLEAQTQSNAR
jgi:rod shape-determining protein MreC